MNKGQQTQVGELSGYQFEIPSVEHPRLLQAAIDEAGKVGVRIGRISQGGGAQLLTRAELAQMRELSAASDIKMFIFVSPRNTFSTRPDPSGREEVDGASAFRQAVDEIRFLARHGVDGVLVADMGLLAVAGEMVSSGELPPLILKTSVAIAPRNPATARLYESLGATSINVSSATPIRDLIEIRKALSVSTTIDIYLEGQADNPVGLRYHEVADLVVHLAPVNLKLGLSGAPALYPYGLHLEPAAERAVRERVRRAAIVQDILDRTPVMSRE